MILDIVYAADHAYLFLCAVSVWSLMEEVPAHTEVRLHLLLDDSFSEEDERLLSYMSQRFTNLSLVKHMIREGLFEKRDFKGSIWSRAACYRLILPELLADTDLCLYIDSDTLIVGDISPLWDTDMTDCCLAGVFDDISPVRSQTVGDHIPGIEGYINSGVLFMNLALMRRMEIQKKLLAGLTDYLVVDQDLLNVVCYGSIRLLPADYNCIPGVYAENPKILHFPMRDYLRPWKNLRAAGSRKWWDTAEHFQGLYDVEGLRRQADWYRRGSISGIFRRCADYAGVYIVGSGLDAERIHRALRLGKCRGLRGRLKEDETIPFSEDLLLICASRKKKIPLIETFKEEGGTEQQVIRFEKRPVSFYHLIPENYRREVYAELLMWEFGVDHRGISSLAALLEINAARYPDREAFVEVCEGKRTACSWKKLNEMANRMADWLRKYTGRRGEAVCLPIRASSVIDVYASLMGILKAGCLTDLTGRAALMAEPEVLTQTRYHSGAPIVEALPHEPALSAGGKTYTAGDLCAMAEDVRRRLGWHSGDRLLIELSSLTEGMDDSASAREEHRIHDLILIGAAFAYGNTTIFVRDESSGNIIQTLEDEKASIASIRSPVFNIMKGKGKENVHHDLRLVLLQDQDKEDRTGYECPIPVSVNGQGYQGEFYYNCEWY